MNPVDRRVKLIVGQAVARAYGMPQPVDDHADRHEPCMGDGCVWCQWSGLQSAVKA